MVKNIIFDFGNVLLNLDEGLTERKLMALLDPLKSSDLFEMVLYPFERGEISEESFFNRLQRRSVKPLDAALYIEAWNAMLLDFPARRIEMLISLRTNFKVFLLSNTNITHLRQVRRKIERENQLQDFESLLFDKAYYSFEMGLRKPEPLIFQSVLDDAGLVAGECLFIDDKLENVAGARSIGIPVHHHDPQQDIADVLFPLLQSF